MIAVVLAAGSSARFGESKMNYLYEGKPILLHTLDNLHSANRNLKISVVVGGYQEEVESILPSYIQEVIVNKDYSKGIGTSVKLALELAKSYEEDLLITLGDLPFVTNEDYINLLDDFSGKPLFSRFDEAIGPPCIIPIEEIIKLKELSSKKGLKSLVSHFETFTIQAAAQDIDQKSDLQFKGLRVCFSSINLN